MEYKGLSAKIKQYIDTLKDIEIGKVKKQKAEVEKALEAEKVSREKRASKAKGPSKKEVKLEEEIADLDKQIETIEYNFVDHRWLTDAAQRAKPLSFATHAIKYTHVHAVGSSVLSLQKQDVDSGYMTTETLKDPRVDVVGSAGFPNALGAANLSKLEHNGDSLMACLKRGDGSALVPFTQNQDQLKEWVRGFSLALADKPLKSHALAKQFYFPVSEQQYHLLSPLFSSPLAQAIYDRIIYARFDDKTKPIRDAKKHKKYSQNLAVSYPKTAVQNFGDKGVMKQRNVSQLNGVRGGKAFLLSSAPPPWQAQLKPPVNSKSIFSSEYNRRAWRQAQSLQRYLLSIQDCDSTMAIRHKLAAYLDELVDTLFNYAAEIQSMTQYAGWSADAKNLKRAQQLWLDPYRKDPLFQEERARGDWQEQIADDFAFWLKRKLNHEKLIFGKVEDQEWMRFFIRRLRKFEAGLPEVSL